MALGFAAMEIPSSIVLGRVALWFFDKIVLFFVNFRDPDRPKQKIDRDVWTGLVLSLIVGFPLWLIGSYDWSK